ncbi:oxidoreductase, Gfo/Idh/MocA family protein [Reinekea sp. MED297]|uniref:Oxidoreductase, Gfo/Idh/MocA family protein n=2 Tax=Reinekea TaxID=230494 RepID=A4BIF9_9GAMM|nr:oxidoreductase, Gfo/Idh/MocA family protein [Reinekea sp. MED297] [Reinekea blandensis MED297]
MDDQYELVAGVFSNIEQENTESAELLGVASERCYADYREMFAVEAEREDGIEVVVIVTPNFLHFEVAKAALEAGLAVICEKPMTLTLAEAIELDQLAESTGAPFLLTHTYSGYPLVQEARQLIADGEIGDVLTFSVQYLQEWLTKEPEKNDRQAAWRLDAKLAGAAGCLGDIGTHAFQLASYIMDADLTSISANLTRSIPSRQVDDNVHATLVFNDHIRGHLWASQTAPGIENNLNIKVVGRKATLEWSQEEPNVMWLRPYGEPSKRITRRAEFLGEYAASSTRTPGGHPEGYLEAFANLYSKFAEKIRKQGFKKGWLADTRTGVQGMQFIELAIESDQRGGEWVHVGEDA